MAKVMITIEDGETGAEVSWTSDDPDYVIHPHGTQAEEIAYMILKLLAKAGGVDLSTVKTQGESNN